MLDLEGMTGGQEGSVKMYNLKEKALGDQSMIGKMFLDMLF